MKFFKDFLFAGLSFLLSAPSVYADAGLPGGSYNPATGRFMVNRTLGGVIEQITALLAMVIPIMMMLALIYFIYGLAEYIKESGDTGKITEGRTRMIWGVLAMFVIISVWGLVRFLDETFKLDNREMPLPRFSHTHSFAFTDSDARSIITVL